MLNNRSCFMIRGLVFRAFLRVVGCFFFRFLLYCYYDYLFLCYRYLIWCVLIKLGMAVDNAYRPNSAFGARKFILAVVCCVQGITKDTLTNTALVISGDLYYVADS